jgi:hypothetical protein
MKKLMSAFVIAAMCAAGGSAYAQSTAKQDAKKAGQATKAAAKDTGEAAKDAGKATGKATVGAAKATKNAVAGNTVTATCKDGSTYTGKSKKGACSKHGGVKTWDKA